VIWLIFLWQSGSRVGWILCQCAGLFMKSKPNPLTGRVLPWTSAAGGGEDRWGFIAVETIRRCSNSFYWFEGPLQLKLKRLAASQSDIRIHNIFIRVCSTNSKEIKVVMIMSKNSGSWGVLCRFGKLACRHRSTSRDLLFILPHPTGVSTQAMHLLVKQNQ